MSIEIEIKNGVFILTMNRPDKKNAITHEMYVAMTEALQRASQQNQVRCVLIKGGKDFTVGNDLDDFKNSPAKDQDAPAFKFVREIMDFDKPIVAAVRGFAVGIGVTILLHCDMVYAARGSAFSLPFLQLGLCPEAAASLLLPRLAGHQRASEMLLIGEGFGAEEAQQAGLVNRVVDDDKVVDIAMAQAIKVAQLPPAAVRLTKALLKQETQEEAALRFRQEGDSFIQLLHSAEAREALEAFFRKRKPDFSRFV
ncbi:enoyl-CoA hydratase [Noviherbaspirillum saxi]|uniref:Enoyl-CoA hydratase n=1 Tax=Noviherbaspirillum saxi TaxID=2320863 RepID=A0A3A3GFU5_9BURK|nr:enoyl-CoA hydratase [Noviherbaspirillum saxi]RJF99779.1 enoyl-CoA hydratase [Noviherbaspirillum saxi]